MTIALLMTRVGQTLIPARPRDHTVFVAEAKEGEAYRVRLLKPRSANQHRLFFAAIREARYHWPHDHEFQPEDEHHLRAWLLCKVGHHEPPIDIQYAGDPQTAAQAIVAIVNAVRDRKKHCFHRVGASVVRVFVPRTLRHDEVDQKEFAPVAQAVFDIIQGVVGVDPMALVKAGEARRALAKAGIDGDFDDE